MRTIIIALGLFLAACSTDPVYLKNTGTGAVVQCGPYATRGPSSTNAAWQESQCISDYQRQGYERVPGPS
jgi:hypothetical protein